MAANHLHAELRADFLTAIVGINAEPTALGAPVFATGNVKPKRQAKDRADQFGTLVGGDPVGSDQPVRRAELPFKVTDWPQRKRHPPTVGLPPHTNDESLKFGKVAVKSSELDHVESGGFD